MPDRRNADLAKIHIARKQLGLDEDTYRAVLWTVARVRSAKDLDDAGRHAVLDHLRARGFKARRSGRSTPPADKAGLVAKIRALLGDRSERYADGVAKRMFGVSRYEWCSEDQLRRIVAALNYDRKRKERA